MPRRLTDDKGLRSIRAIFGLIFKITLIMSNDTKELVSLKNEKNHKRVTMVTRAQTYIPSVKRKYTTTSDLKNSV